MHEKGLQRQKRRRSTGHQPGKRSVSRPADKPRINRLSTGDFVHAFGLHRISLVRAFGETFRRRFFDALEGTKDLRCLGEHFCWHPILPDPARPPRRAPRPDPPVRSMFGFWTRQVGLHRISLIRASGETTSRRVCDASEDTKEACHLCEQFYWHPVLPDPAPSRRRVPDPTRPWFVRVLDTTSCV